MHDDTPRRGGQAGIQAVEVAAGVLAALARAEGAARLTDLACAAGLPPAKLHRYLVSLVRAGLAARDAESGRYDLGPLAWNIGLKVLGRSDRLKAAEPMLRTLVAEAGETAALAVWGTYGPTIVRLVEARHDMTMTLPPGHVCALTGSAAGLVFCAWGTDPAIATAAARELAQNRRMDRPEAPSSAAELAELTEVVRARGYASVADPSGLSAVSAPVFDATGMLVMSLAILARGGWLGIKPDAPVTRLVRREAARLSRALGCIDLPA